MVAITEEPDPPRHLVLGAWGNDQVVARLGERLAEIEAWRERGAATDYDAG